MKFEVTQMSLILILLYLLCYHDYNGYVFICVGETVPIQPDQMLYPCQICGWVFHTEEKFLDHMTKHRPPVSRKQLGPFVCQVCSKEFAHRSRLGEHMMKHSNARPFHCPTCGATFKHKKHLNHHLNVSRDCGFKNIDWTLSGVNQVICIGSIFMKFVFSSKTTQRIYILVLALVMKWGILIYHRNCSGLSTCVVSLYFIFSLIYPEKCGLQIDYRNVKPAGLTEKSVLSVNLGTDLCWLLILVTFIRL